MYMYVQGHLPVPFHNVILSTIYTIGADYLHQPAKLQDSHLTQELEPLQYIF